MPAPPLATTAYGAGPAVLLVHGWSGFRDAWHLLPAGLAHAGLRAVTVDLPGWGESAPPGRRRHTPAAYADALEPLVRRVRPMALVGHSTGTQSVLTLAARHPEIARLALLAPLVVPVAEPRVPPRSLTDALSLPVVGRALAHLALRWVQRDDRGAWAGYRRAVADPAGLARDPEVVALARRAVAGLRGSDRTVLVESLRAAIHADLRPTASRVRQPTLVVVGERDRAVHPGQAASAVGSLLDGRLLRLPGVGHLPHVEAPRRTLDALLAHLSSARGAAAAP